MTKLPAIAELYSPRNLDDLAAEMRAFKQWPLDRQIEYVRGLIHDSPQFNARWGGGWTYRRVRKLGPDERLTSHQDLIWNPNPPARVGRMNLEGVPMFYAADRAFTALREARVEDDRVAMMSFQVQARRCFQVVTFGELAQLQVSGRGHFILAHHEAASMMNGFIKAGDPIRVLAAILIDSFLLECLQDPGEDYGLSGATAAIVFEKHPQIDAFAYPSVRQHGSVCLAVRTEGFWDVWGVQTVQAGRVIHLGYGVYRPAFDEHVSAIDAEGMLSWGGEDGTLRRFAPIWHLGMASVAQDRR